MKRLRRCRHDGSPKTKPASGKQTELSAGMWVIVLDPPTRHSSSHQVHLCSIWSFTRILPWTSRSPAYEWMMTDIARIIAFLKREYPLPQVDPVRSLLPLYNLIQADPLQAWVRDCVQALIDDGQGPTIDAVVCLHRPSLRLLTVVARTIPLLRPLPLHPPLPGHPFRRPPHDPLHPAYPPSHHLDH